ncbi:dipeptidyl aminopeptidase/acylaminoacyl peptidase [Flavobacterium sp. 102]|nr:dipeptidyl aminopeptidase/acylaminoacyl peptidase [Flavobacterium sp. 102]
MACSVNGQVKKTRQLTAEDYHLWSTLNAEGISGHGSWVSYSLSYESGLDTLFVKSATTAKIVAFAKGYGGRFFGDSWFGCMLPDNRFRLVNLLSDKVQDVENVQQFDFIDHGKYVLLYCAGKNGKTDIVIRDFAGVAVAQVANVNSYTMNKSHDLLAYCITEPSGNSLGLLRFGKKLVKTVVTTSADKQFENVVWKNDGKAIAFVSRRNDAKAFTADSVLYYVIGSGALYSYETETALNWPKDMVLDANFTSSLGIADDGERVFFMIKKREAVGISNPSGIAVWIAADKDLYSFRNKYGASDDDRRLTVWYPKNGNFMAVGDSVQPSAVLNGNQKYALVYNANDNKPSWKQEADRDYYLYDISTGKKTLFLKQQAGSIGTISFSPDGNYIAYFRDRDWWLYSIAKGTHTNITRKTGIAFYDDATGMAELPLYGAAGWWGIDNGLLLYDQFDLWQLTTADGNLKRVTHGRESNQVFRLVVSRYADGITAKRDTIEDAVLLLKSNTTDSRLSGYYSLNQNRKLEPIVFTDKGISGLHKSAFSDCYVYVSEDFNAPPSLLVKEAKASPKTVYQSNRQHYNYDWGTSRLIDYKNSKGVALKGVLVYPFDYDPQKQYPMIVYIYEKQNFRLHTYVNPTFLNGSDMNATLFSSQGYFVLYPDSVYELGKPGLSATDCVLSATEVAVRIAPIDRSKIGLTGHSFGGYQTDFIMTQTNVFATAIAGAAITDLVSGYLSVNPNEIKFDCWRFEYQQLRMGKSLFEDFERYRANSPITYASQVSKPIFSYTGMEDTQVVPNQTMEFYLALRRLNKTHIMVLYPGDDHVIEKEENQIDLTNRKREWFDYYLKDGKRPEWFSPQ